MSDERFAHLQSATNPRRATQEDAGTLARLFAAAFLKDPVFDWIARPGPKRAAGLERFFYWLMQMRAIPFGEVWMADDGGAAAAWLPPGTPASPGGMLEQIKLLPMFMRLCGFPRLGRGSAMADAMEKTSSARSAFLSGIRGGGAALSGNGIGFCHS